MKQQKKKLTQTIANALNLGWAAQLKLTALEELLKERDAELYATYQKRVADLANHKAIDANAQALEGLHKALAQDRG